MKIAWRTVVCMNDPDKTEMKILKQLLLSYSMNQFQFSIELRDKPCMCSKPLNAEENLEKNWKLI